MSYQNLFVAFTALLAVTNAHIKITKPVPFDKDTLDTSPITKAQFPCKRNPNQPFKVSETNQMAVKTPQKLQFSGTAVHGGGSCQLSITTDPDPTENSVFKVIKSIEGGCPGVDGSTKEYDFELPDSIPNGKATFAWTWFSKMSGAPELYMNCAPIEVTGGASDDSGFKALPDMLVMNIGEGCTSPQNFATKFPNPGSVVEDGGLGDAKPPTGSCGSSSGGSSPAQSSSPAGQPSPAKSSAVAQPSSPAGGQPAASPKPSASAAPPSNPGGVFAPGASSVAGAPALTSTTLVTVTAAPTPAKPSASAAPSGGASAPAQPSAPSSPSSGGGAAGSCTSNGAIVCNGTKQFGICNNGNVVWQDVAAGTACANGVISKRSFNSRVARPRYRSPRVAMPFGY